MGELALQRWRPQDRDALYAAVSSTLEHLRPWMPWVADYDRSSTGQFLARCEDGWARGESFEYAILAGDGQILGSTGLMTRIAPGGLEIGYWVHGAHTRKRVATRAVAALAEAALRLSWVTHVEIHHDEANVASGGVPRRLGFQLVSAVGRDPTPAERGRELQWRMDARDFPNSPAARLLEGLRRADPPGEQSR
ncbi:MAG TPA: GNAT family N-acetyltransferase [Solirubrobacteraceae bacterium]|nr:GNAT family N-acetyltransferase [Solirubrobacteraceae bacterium]